MADRTSELQILKKRFPEREGVDFVDDRDQPCCCLAHRHDRLSESSHCNWTQRCRDCKRFFCSGADIRCGCCDHYNFRICFKCAPIWGSWDTISCQSPSDRDWDTQNITWIENMFEYVCVCGKNSKCCWTPSSGIPPCTHGENGSVATQTEEDGEWKTQRRRRKQSN